MEPARSRSYEELRAILPREKFDVERARAVIALGYPAVAPVLPELLAWLQDMNWPVALHVAEFLRTIGLPLAPEIRRVFATDDLIWKYWIVRRIIAGSPDLLVEMLPELQRIPNHPTPAEIAEGLHEAAEEVLMSHPDDV